jgi:hypothetical protein
MARTRMGASLDNFRPTRLSRRKASAEKGEGQAELARPGGWTGSEAAPDVLGQRRAPATSAHIIAMAPLEPRPKCFTRIPSPQLRHRCLGERY